MRLQLNPTSKDTQIAALAALAIGIHVLESILPSPLPGIKPGFANIITLIAYASYGFEVAVWVAIMRVLVGSLIIGTFLSPTFILSLSGALASILTLYLVMKAGNKWRTIEISLFGLAVLMALAHMLAQFIVVYYLFIPHDAMIKILPIMLLAALIFGSFNGLIANKVNEKLRVKDKN